VIARGENTDIIVTCVMSNSMLTTFMFSLFGNYQLPFLQGLSILEKLAAPLAPFIVGRTGAQLFLTDGEPSKPPLLLLMTSDHEDKKFM
jgi:hypothetical protein